MASELISALATDENKLLACIHCGLCLEACPTYVLTGDENDGPRGRIYLMRAVAEDRLSSESTSFERHINRCLGCRACEPVCPAGVEYGQLLESARSKLNSIKDKGGITQRLLRFTLRHVWPHRQRLNFAFSGARLMRDAGLVSLLLKTRIPQLVSKKFEFALALLQTSRGTNLVRDDNYISPRLDKEESQQPVVLFSGCVTEGLFARVNRSTERVLQVNGCATAVPVDQTCCGALHAHAGDLDGARQLAQQNIRAFTDSGVAPIITNAGGCGAMLLSYPHLFENDKDWHERALAFSARVRDISQQLQVTGLKQGAAIGSEPITYDASCHLINGQYVGDAPMQMLRAIPNLAFVSLAGSDRCCGGAGVYNLMEPELSTAILNEKLTNVRETGATALATGNPGCHMQIGAGAMLDGLPLRVCHPVELLDESYRRAYAEAENNNLK